MLVVFYFLLMLRVTRCKNDPTFETKTVDAGRDVEMECKREGSGSLFWIRIRSGKFPEYLGKSYSLPSLDTHIKTSEHTGAFVLHITKAKLGDTGLYFCMKTTQQNLMFLKGTNLTVKAEPVTTAVSTPEPVHPGESEGKTCPEEHSVCCYRAGSHSGGSNFTLGISVDRDGFSTMKCNCSFFNNTSCQDDGAYFCAADTCEKIKPGNRSNPDNEAVQRDLQTDNTVLHLLSAALAVSLIVIACLLYSLRNLRKQSGGCNKVDVVLQSGTETARNDQQNQQADEDSLIYSAPTFTKRNSGKAGIKGVRPVEEESIYAQVRVPEVN
ncbi:uncharacterized protein LOC117818042 isoform X2 [Notolabrus celidotus]|uniref:uncharacterized protein LOC117818042 isoform X2 n=1 Tax=Notolabrus celidotus TaxID=1203425 RepID=UPI00148F5ABB|nr:uncharacterized protein LOC117818042 isoform X2 [Notolabrus celidotus]